MQAQSQAKTLFQQIGKGMDLKKVCICLEEMANKEGNGNHFCSMRSRNGLYIISYSSGLYVYDQAKGILLRKVG